YLVGRRPRVLGSQLGIIRVAEPADGRALTRAHEAVVVLRLERALLLLAGIRPAPLHVVEGIEAADAAAGSAHLAAERPLHDVGDAAGILGGVAPDPTARHPTSRRLTNGIARH